MPANIKVIKFSFLTGLGSSPTVTLNESATEWAAVTGTVETRLNSILKPHTISTTVDGTATAGGLFNAAANTPASTTYTTVNVGSAAFIPLSHIDLTTQSGAQTALSVIDGAIDEVTGIRATMGAIQNRFEAVTSTNSNASENLSASRSRIQDADFAVETSRMTRAQILQNAATSMLATANAMPNQVLSLLKAA